MLMRLGLQFTCTCACGSSGEIRGFVCSSLSILVVFCCMQGTLIVKPCSICSACQCSGLPCCDPRRGLEMMEKAQHGVSSSDRLLLLHDSHYSQFSYCFHFCCYYFFLLLLSLLLSPPLLLLILLLFIRIPITIIVTTVLISSFLITGTCTIITMVTTIVTSKP